MNGIFLVITLKVGVYNVIQSSRKVIGLSILSYILNVLQSKLPNSTIFDSRLLAATGKKQSTGRHAFYGEAQLKMHFSYIQKYVTKF
jgi:hypothetical protein